MPIRKSDMSFLSLLSLQCCDLTHKENPMPALHGNTPLLGLWDNGSTWQHRAKNIWRAPKITEENEKRVGSAATHLSLQAWRWCCHAEAWSKARERKEASPRNGAVPRWDRVRGDESPKHVGRRKYSTSVSTETMMRQVL